MGSRGHIMTLANSIIGVGILAMPFCFQKCGIVLAIILLIISNFITRLCCHYLIKSSLTCRRRSMEIIAFSVFGSSGKLMVELSVIGYLMGACITYYVVVGDLGPQITAKMFDLNQTSTLRTIVMILVTIVCVIPLGLQRNVDSLAAVCTASIGFYFCLVLKIMAESTEQLSTGDWMDKVDYWKVSGILQCLPIFSMALSCQMQLFEVFESVSNISIDKMNEYVKSATTICTFVYILVGFFGYVAFCTKPFSGNILLNLSPSLASDAIKIGFVLSVAFSFPLMIFPCRASLYSLLYRRGHADVAHYIPENRFKLITISLVCLALLAGILIPSIELIIGFVGSTIGVVICIMFPASCYIKICQKNSTEKLLAQVLLIFGFILMVLGTYANLSAIDEQNSGPSLEEKQSIFKHYEDSNEQSPLNLSEQLVQLPKIEINQPVVPDLEPVKLESEPFETHPKMIDAKVQEIKYHENSVKELNLVEIDKSLTSIPKPVETSVKLIPLEAEGKDKISSKQRPDDLKKSGDINNEAIQKEDQEIAIEKKEQETDDSKSDRLEETKKLLEEMKEIKNVLEKKNEETQQLVLQKIDEIVDKVEKIEKVQEEENKKHEEEKVGKIVENEVTVEREPKNSPDLNSVEQKAKEIVPNDAEERTHVVKNQTIKSPIVQMLINNQVNQVESSVNENKEISSTNNKMVNVEQPAKTNHGETGGTPEIEHIPIQRDLLNVKSKEIFSTQEASVRNKRDAEIYSADCHKPIIDNGIKSHLENENIFQNLGSDIVHSVKIMGGGRDLKSVDDKL